MFLESLLLFLPLVTGASVISSNVSKSKNGILKEGVLDGYSTENLNLSNMKIELIQEKAFKNLNYLKTLNLENNPLKNLPEFVFSSLTRLENLSLAQNHISDIKKNTFVGLDSLKSLNLSLNPLNFLAYGSLFGLRKDVNIYVNETKIHYITPMIFEDMTHSNKTNHSETHLKKIEYPIGTKFMPEMITTRLCVLQNIIKSIEILKEGVEISDFCKEVKVDSLSLFSGWLHLNSYESKGCIPHWYELNNSDIKSIDLSRNVIAEDYQNCLKYLPENIEEIDLSYNRIQKLRAVEFLDIKHILILSLRSNVIDDIQEETFKNTNIRRLDLSSNRVNNLKFVNSLPETINSLDLHSNRIESISEEINFHLPNLRILNLSGNNITTLMEKTFSELKSLETLDLSDNGLSSIFLDAFASLNRLKSLNLQQNSISSLQKEVFEDLHQLERLNLSMNSITDIEKGAFRNNSFLIDLNLSQNELQQLENGVLYGLPKSARVDIYENDIEVIQSSVFEDIY